MNKQGIEEAAAALKQAWLSGKPCSPIREMLAAGDVDAAYAVQEIGTRDLLIAGRRLVGRKIGLTSPAVQKQLGVDQPDYGMLFDYMDVPLGATIPWTRLQQPKVEAEIAFILGSDLNREGLTTADVMKAVDYVVPAIEVVGSRIANWDIRIVDTVADNASSSLFVLGHTPRRLIDVDVVNAGMALTRGDTTVSVGRGSACLGSPLSALLWLAQVMVARGRPLQAGDVVLSGALGPMVAVSPGDHFEALVEGLGSVRAIFGSNDD